MSGRDIMGRPIRAEGSAGPDTPMEDFWPPLRFTPDVARAYKRAESEGLIRIERLLASRQLQTVTVRYLSSIPVPKWTHEMLKAYKKKEISAT